MPVAPQQVRPPRACWTRDADELVLELSGEWRQDGPAPEVVDESPDHAPDRYATEDLGGFDSTLPAFILAHLRMAENPTSAADENGVSAKFPLEGLAPDLRGLMELALAVPEESEAGRQPAESSAIWKIGEITIAFWKSILSLAEFCGLTVFSFGRFLIGKGSFRGRDFWMIVQECGPRALPIVTLISFLIGVILAFVGEAQLASFGASIYVADLVGIAMVREMGVVMTGIIMSGRTGAAFAAHLGSMKANEEIDALKTFGFDPFDFLVLPRVIALVLMMPLLTLYANLVGILGGMLVGAAVGIPPVLYWNETLATIDLTNASLGVFKSVFFGAAIAISGCLQGMHAENSSAAVGEATTRAVVAAITAVIVIDSLFAAIFTVLGI
jgi:phospholipid/cholesterol/gamma-HCH transport system permease protein